MCSCTAHVDMQNEISFRSSRLISSYVNAFLVAIGNSVRISTNVLNFGKIVDCDGFVWEGRRNSSVEKTRVV